MNAMKAWWSGRIAQLILNLDFMEVSGQIHAPAALLPAEKPPVQMNKRGWAPELVWTLALTRNRTVVPPLSSLYPDPYSARCTVPYFCGSVIFATTLLRLVTAGSSNSFP